MSNDQEVRFDSRAGGLQVKVRSCARCNSDHDVVFFKSFTRPVENYTHWGTCPNTGEPILMKITFCL